MFIITISGIDRSGKTSLLSALNAATGFIHFIIERDPSAVMFFRALLNRDCKISYAKYLERYSKLTHQFNSLSHLAIFLHTDVDVLIKRFAITDEPALPGGLSINDHQHELFDYFQSANYKNCLILNTSTASVTDCVEEIIRKLEKLNAY